MYFLCVCVCVCVCPEERPVLNGRYTHVSRRVLLSDILRCTAQNLLDET